MKVILHLVWQLLFSTYCRLMILSVILRSACCFRSISSSSRLVHLLSFILVVEGCCCRFSFKYKPSTCSYQFVLQIGFLWVQFYSQFSYQSLIYLFILFIKKKKTFTSLQLSKGYFWIFIFAVVSLNPLSLISSQLSRGKKQIPLKSAYPKSRLSLSFTSCKNSLKSLILVRVPNNHNPISLKFSFLADQVNSSSLCLLPWSPENGIPRIPILRLPNKSPISVSQFSSSPFLNINW